MKFYAFFPTDLIVIFGPHDQEIVKLEVVQERLMTYF